MNRKKNKAEVVRTKIMTHYFSEAFNVECTFMDFTMVVMPDAVGWIGSDCLGYSTMYCPIRSMPWLLESKNSTVGWEPPTKHLDDLDRAT